MSKTHFRTYLSRFFVNLNAFEYIGATEDQRGNRRPALGRQSPSLQAELTLFIGDEENPREAGDQPYVFTAKNTTATESHRGLPPMSEVLPAEVLDAWLSQLGMIIDEKLPFYSDESDEAQTGGPEGFIRVNRIEVNLPWNRPDQHSIAVISGLYEDKDFNRQVISSSIVVTFVTPEFAERVFRESHQREPSSAELATFMAANDMFDLGGFIGIPAVQQGVATMVNRMYTTLKTRVYQYAGINVETIMTRFAETIGDMYPAAEVE